MSLLSKVFSGAKAAVSGLARIPGVGAVMKLIPGLGTAATAVSAYQVIKGIGSSAVETVAAHPAIAAGVLGAAGGALAERAMPGAGGLAPLAMGGGMVRAPGMRSLARSAASYARRYPQWAMQVGGTAAIAQMIASGALPPMRRRRGHGITPRDLRSFKRVARLVSHFSRPVHHMRGYKRASHRGG